MKKNILMLSALFLSITAMAQTDVTTGVMRGKDYGVTYMLPKTETEKQEFFDVNYQGTINLCTALEKIGSPKALIFISTVAVYGCEYG